MKMCYPILRCKEVRVLRKVSRDVQKDRIRRLTASVYISEIHMSTGGGQSGPSEIILNNMYIAALVAFFCMPSAVTRLAYLCAQMFP